MTEPASPWLGIDFGTCRSSAAVFIGNEPRSVSLGYGYNHDAFDMSTAVFINEDGTMRVGEEAVGARGADTTRYFDRFKLSIGSQQGVSAFVHAQRRRYAWRELVAAILQRIRSAAEAQLGGGKRLTRAVITVPALYAVDGPQWQVMDDAARDAGFDTVRLLREPYAAAVYFDSVMRRTRGLPAGEGAITLVYDLGGGTFDPALIRRGANGHELIGATGGTDGVRCGGIFFDEKIRDDFRAKCPGAAEGLQPVPRRGDGTLDPADVPRARRNARDSIALDSFLTSVKHRFSAPEVREVREVEPVTFGEEYLLTRAELDAMIGPSLDATIDCCETLVRRSGVEWSNIERIIMVGGSCNLPLVRERLQAMTNSARAGHIEICWRRVAGTDGVLDPLLAVSLGAAIAGAKSDDSPSVSRSAVAAESVTAAPPPVAKAVVKASPPPPPPPRRVTDGVSRRVMDIIVEQLGVDADEVTSDASFVEDLGADSLDTVELVMAFEEEFGVEISDDDAEKIRRVRDAIEYIDKRAKAT